jgi:uncharacterized membrane protein YedE/YeeE
VQGNERPAVARGVLFGPCEARTNGRAWLTRAVGCSSTSLRADDDRFAGARLGRRAAPAPALKRIHPAETTPSHRYLDAFVGSFLILFGARLAGGCTSGHIISSITQLAVSSRLFGAAVFASGILTAKLLQRRA